MKIGEVIKNAIKTKGLTQGAVAFKIGISETSLSAIVKNKHFPHQHTLEKITKILEIPIPVILFLSMSEKDVPKDRIELYKVIQPFLKDMIVKLYM